MTAITAMPPPVEKFVRRFVARRLVLALAAAAGWALAAGAGVGMLFCVIDRLAALPAGVRLAMLGVDAILMLAIALRPLRGRPRLGRGGLAELPAPWVSAARDIERRTPIFQERLVTVASQLAAAPEARGSVDLLDVVMADLARQAAASDVRGLFSHAPLLRAWGAALAAVLLAVALSPIGWLGLPRLALRLVAPLGHTRPVTVTQLSVDPAGADVQAGEGITIRVTAAKFGDQPPALYLSATGGTWSRSAMIAQRDLPGVFSYTLDAVHRDLHYYVRAGDATSERFVLRVQHVPAVAEFQIHYTYPAYTHRPGVTAGNADGFIEAPAGTIAGMTIVANEPLAAATLVLGKDRLAMTSRAGDRTKWSAELKVDADATYELELLGAGHASARESEPMTIHALPDRPPLARLLQPSEDLQLTRRDVVHLHYEAIDDYGLAALALHVSRNGDPAAVAPVAIPPNAIRAAGELSLDLLPLEVHVGDVVLISLRAADSSGQKTPSELRRVLVVPEPLDSRLRQRQAELRQAAHTAALAADSLDQANRAAQMLAAIRARNAAATQPGEATSGMAGSATAPNGSPGAESTLGGVGSPSGGARSAAAGAGSAPGAAGLPSAPATNPTTAPAAPLGDHAGTPMDRVHRPPPEPRPEELAARTTRALAAAGQATAAARLALLRAIARGEETDRDTAALAELADQADRQGARLAALSTAAQTPDQETLLRHLAPLLDGSAELAAGAKTIYQGDLAASVLTGSANLRAIEALPAGKAAVQRQRSVEHFNALFGAATAELGIDPRSPGAQGQLQNLVCDRDSIIELQRAGDLRGAAAQWIATLALRGALASPAHPGSAAGNGHVATDSQAALDFPGRLRTAFEVEALRSDADYLLADDLELAWHTAQKSAADGSAPPREFVGALSAVLDERDLKHGALVITDNARRQSLRQAAVAARTKLAAWVRSAGSTTAPPNAAYQVEAMVFQVNAAEMRNDPSLVKLDQSIVGALFGSAQEEAREYRQALSRFSAAQSELDRLAAAEARLAGDTQAAAADTAALLNRQKQITDAVRRVPPLDLGLIEWPGKPAAVDEEFIDALSGQSPRLATHAADALPATRAAHPPNDPASRPSAPPGRLEASHPATRPGAASLHATHPADAAPEPGPTPADLIAAHPLLAAGVLARLAEESLARGHDVRAAVDFQRRAAAALRLAEAQALHRAAQIRLAALPTFEDYFQVSESGVANKTFTRGWLGSPKGNDAASHESDLPQYRDALKAYFETLGRAREAKP